MPHRRRTLARGLWVDIEALNARRGRAASGAASFEYFGWYSTFPCVAGALVLTESCARKNAAPALCAVLAP